MVNVLLAMYINNQQAMIIKMLQTVKLLSAMSSR